MNNKQQRSFLPKNLVSTINKPDLLRGSLSNSPFKKKTSAQFYKERKQINDIEVDKESLFQLNRVTNQFFASKIRETLSSQKIVRKFDETEDEPLESPAKM